MSSKPREFWIPITYQQDSPEERANHTLFIEKCAYKNVQHENAMLKKLCDADIRYINQLAEENEKLKKLVSIADWIFCSNGFTEFQGVEEKHIEWYTAKKEAGIK